MMKTKIIAALKLPRLFGAEEEIRLPIQNSKTIFELLDRTNDFFHNASSALRTPISAYAATLRSLADETFEEDDRTKLISFIFRLKALLNDLLLHLAAQQLHAFFETLFPKKRHGSLEHLLEERKYFKSDDPYYLPGNMGNAFGWHKLWSESMEADAPAKRGLKAIKRNARFFKRTLNLKTHDPRDPYFDHYYAELLAHLPDELQKPSYDKHSEYVHVEYFTQAQKEPHRIFIVKGFLCQLDVDAEYGICLKTMDTSDTKENTVIVILNRRGELFSYPKDSVTHGTSPRLYKQHSSCESGKAVLFAGFWQVDHGIIKHVFGYSGHYQSDFTCLRYFFAYLKSHDCCLSHATATHVVRAALGARDSACQTLSFETEDVEHILLSKKPVMLREIPGAAMRASLPLHVEFEEGKPIILEGLKTPPGFYNDHMPLRLRGKIHRR